ncbi:transcriptional repressor [Pseudomonas sp. LRF_L74]|uniref:transcriptional repressor n=1 Tax=Pseudomonas sp. LRF_L74 TaxID=3369422 RepID=UPI003F632D45
MPPSHHQEQKDLLQSAGLKVSLMRLKIVEVLQRAETQALGLPAAALHARLMDEDERISILSVRQVLCRLHACGLIERDGKRRYRLVAEQGKRAANS